MKPTEYAQTLIEKTLGICGLSYNAALKIQKEQAAHYLSIGYSKASVDSVLNKTKPLPAGMDPDAKMSVGEINKLVPRGGAFEFAK